MTATSPRWSTPGSEAARRSCSTPPPARCRRWPSGPPGRGRTDEWAATVEGLHARGLVEADGSFTDAGRALREEIEDRTDRLGLQPYEAIGEDGCAELRSLVRPWSTAIVSGDDFGFAR